MLTRRSLETLIDLVEIKLSMIEIYDRDDQREVLTLKQCLKELMALCGSGEKAPAMQPALAVQRNRSALRH